jgi:hypothetical protein
MSRRRNFGGEASAAVGRNSINTPDPAMKTQLTSPNVDWTAGPQTAGRFRTGNIPAKPSQIWFAACRMGPEGMPLALLGLG